MADCVRVAEDVGGPVLGTVAGLALAVQVFSLFVTADHWCWDSNVAALRAQLPLGAEDAKRFSLPRLEPAPRLPFSSASNVDATEFSRCARYDGDLAGAYVGWVAARRPPYRGEHGSNRTACDQGWEYNTTQGYHSLSAQMNWVCDSNWKVYCGDVTFWVGGALGAAIITGIANRWGRGFAVLSSTLMALLGCGSSLILTSSTGLVLATRASLGLCHLPLLAAMELLEDRRALTPIFLCVPSLLAPWLATCLGYWWYMTAVLVTGVAVAVCVLCWFSFEEILKNLSRRRLADGSCITPDRYSLECPIVVDCSAESKTDLTKEPEMSSQHPLAFEFVRFLCGLCYYGNIYSSITLLGSRWDPKRQFASYCYAGLAELPAWLLHDVSSNGVFAVYLAGAAISGIAHSVVPEAEAFVLGVTLFLLQRLLITSAFHHLRLKNPTTRYPCSQLSQGMALAVMPCILYTREYYSHLPNFLFGIAALVGFAVQLSYGAVSSITKLKRVAFPFDSMNTTQKQRKSTLVTSSLPYNPMNT